MIDFSEMGVKFSAAFVAAQAEMESAKKDATNPAFNRGGNGGKYATLTAVIDAVEPVLNRHGIGVLQSIGEVDPNGFLEVETVLLHGESGERVSFKMGIKVSKLDAQGQGSAATYGRRYTLSALCGLAVEDDDGNAAAGKKTPREELVEKLLADGILAHDVSRVLRNCAYSEFSDEDIGWALSHYEKFIKFYIERKKVNDAVMNEEIPVPEEA